MLLLSRGEVNMAWNEPFWCLCGKMLTWEDVCNTMNELRRCPHCRQVWEWNEPEIAPIPVDIVYREEVTGDVK